MFSIRSRQPRSRVAIVTGTLIVCDLLAFCYELMLGPDLPLVMRFFGMRPRLFISYWWIPSVKDDSMMSCFKIGVSSSFSFLSNSQSGAYSFNQGVDEHIPQK